MSPLGSVSPKPIPLSEDATLGLAIVKVRLVELPSPRVGAPKAMAIVGGFVIGLARAAAGARTTTDSAATKNALAIGLERRPTSILLGLDDEPDRAHSMRIQFLFSTDQPSRNSTPEPTRWSGRIWDRLRRGEHVRRYGMAPFEPCDKVRTKRTHSRRAGSGCLRLWAASQRGGGGRSRSGLSRSCGSPPSRVVAVCCGRPSSLWLRCSCWPFAGG